MQSDKNKDSLTDLFKDKSLSSCTAMAPSSTANIGPGYDVFGLGVDALEDRVKITKINSNGTQKIHIKTTYTYNNRALNKSGKNSENPFSASIPSDAELNSAGLVIKKLMQDYKVYADVEVEIEKGVPAGYGMGSSAASAAASAVAFNRLFDLKINKSRLVEYAAEGEIASAGIKHYDNVSGSLLGGFVIIRTDPTLRFIRIEPPDDLVLMIAVPLVQVPKKKTEAARAVIPSQVSLKDMVHNVANASIVVSGFILKDVEMIADGIQDTVVEPARKHLIEGYEEIKMKAKEAGALATTISGAGPSMISITKGDKNSKQVADAMIRGFQSAGNESIAFVCRPSKGAIILKTQTAN